VKFSQAVRQAILAEMRKHDIKPAKLAKRMGTAQSTINAWLIGSREHIGMATLDALCDALREISPQRLASYTLDETIGARQPSFVSDSDRTEAVMTAAAVQKMIDAAISSLRRRCRSQAEEVGLNCTGNFRRRGRSQNSWHGSTPVTDSIRPRRRARVFCFRLRVPCHRSRRECPCEEVVS